MAFSFSPDQVKKKVRDTQRKVLNSLGGGGGRRPRGCNLKKISRKKLKTFHRQGKDAAQGQGPGGKFHFGQKKYNSYLPTKDAGKSIVTRGSTQKAAIKQTGPGDQAGAKGLKDKSIQATPAVDSTTHHASAPNGPKKGEARTKKRGTAPGNRLPKRYKVKESGQPKPGHDRVP